MCHTPRNEGLQLRIVRKRAALGRTVCVCRQHQTHAEDSE